MFRFRGSWSSGSSYLYVGFDLRVLLVKIFRVFVSVFGFWQWLTLFVSLSEHHRDQLDCCGAAHPGLLAAAWRWRQWCWQLYCESGGGDVGSSLPSTCPQMALVEHDSERWCAQLWRLSSWLLCLGSCSCAHLLCSFLMLYCHVLFFCVLNNHLLVCFIANAHSKCVNVLVNYLLNSLT